VSSEGVASAARDARRDSTAVVVGVMVISFDSK